MIKTFVKMIDEKNRRRSVRVRRGGKHTSTNTHTHKEKKDAIHQAIILRQQQQQRHHCTTTNCSLNFLKII